MPKSNKAREVEPKPSVSRGGPAVVANLLATRLRCTVSGAQADALWGECKTHLREQAVPDVIAEIEESPDGRLDTYPREYALDALGHVLAGLTWPLNADGPAYSARFAQKMAAALSARGCAIAST